MRALWLLMEIGITAMSTHVWAQESKQSTPSRGYTIRGQIKLSEEWKPVVYLAEIRTIDHFFVSSSSILIDSAEIAADGSFVLSGDSLFNKRVFYRLTVVKKGNPPATIIYGTSEENMIFLLLEDGEEVTIEAVMPDMAINYTVHGSRANAQIKQVRLLGKGRHDAEDVAQLKSFIDTVRDPLMALFALAHFGIWDITLERHMDLCKKLDARFQKLAPDDRYVQQFHKKIIEYKTVVPIGSMAPDIVLKDTSGKEVALSSLGDKKLILIDFWASWCKPCRIENRNTVLPLYKQYSDKGFEVYGVSLDFDKDSWIQAIRADQLPWINVSDLKGFGRSEVAKIYGVKFVPMTILIDGNRKVLAKNVRGEELKAFVTEFFQ